MSLPFKLRALPVSEINKWPIFGTRCELFPYGISQDIISLFPAAFLMPQPMFKEITLPADANVLGRPFFPFADDALYGFTRWREGNQGVNMIGHEQEQIRPPKPFLLSMPEGFEESRRNFIYGQLVCSSHFAINGDEVNLSLRINPKGDFVRQWLPAGNGHGKMIRPDPVRNNVEA